MKRTLLLVYIFFASIQLFAQNEFITRWQLPAGQTTLTFHLLLNGGSTNYTWETIPSGQSGNGSLTTSGYNSHTISGLPSGSVIRLSIAPAYLGVFNIQFSADRTALVDVEQWGTASWVSMGGSFSGCSNLNITATDIPNLSQCSDMSWMFRACSNLNGPANINSWNVSTITTMERTFELASQFNQPLSDWNTSSVTSMAHMFSSASSFNQPIGTWNTSNVVTMTNMFSAAVAFNQPLNSWNTSLVTNMSGMFNAASSFNQPLGDWNTSSVTNMQMLFANMNSFNQPISNWNTANVLNFNSMFYNALLFNQPIGNWDTGSATDLSGMFRGATNFNQPIDNWDLSSAQNISSMFISASSFNQSLTNWNTANVTSMSGLFLYASSFNQNIGNWDYSSANNLTLMLDNSGITCDTYDGILSSWASNATFPTAMTIGAQGLYYSDVSSSLRTQLINQNGITFNGDSYAGSTCATAGLDLPSTMKLNLSPNPASEIITVLYNGSTTAQISSLSGSIITDFKLNETTTIHVSDFAPGVYFIRTTEGETIKFVKE